MPKKRLHPDNTHMRVKFPHAFCNAHERPCRTHGGHDHIYFFICVAPYLRRSGSIVGKPVVRVVELIRAEVALGLLPRKSVYSLDRPVRAHIGGRKEYICPIGLHYLAPFHARPLAHGYEAAVALYRANHGKSYARIPAACLEDDLIPGYLTPFFRIGDHGQGHAVLYRASRVEGLHLGEDCHILIGIQPADRYKRCVSYCIEDIS